VGTVVTYTITGADLTQANFNGVTFTDKSGAEQKGVSGEQATLSGVTIKSAVVAPASDTTNDPLNLKGTIYIAPTQDLVSVTGETIPAYSELHYVNSDQGMYTLSGEKDSCTKLLAKFRCDQPRLQKSKDFTIPASSLKNRYIATSWTSGVLVIPYKYGVANHSMTKTSTTLGAYFGRTTDTIFGQLTIPSH